MGETNWVPTGEIPLCTRSGNAAAFTCTGAETLDNGHSENHVTSFRWQYGIFIIMRVGLTMEEEYSQHVATGVVGQIILNFPLLMLAWKVAPALACGNTVLLKPAEQTPLTALWFAECCHRIGLPAGVFQLLTGDGQTGEELVRSSLDKIAFTGSTSVGKRIRELTVDSDCNNAGTGRQVSFHRFRRCRSGCCCRGSGYRYG